MRISDWSSDVCSSDLCSRGSPGHVPSHRGRDGRAPRDQDRRSIMATIGTLKKTANGEFVGDITTLSVQAKGVGIVPDSNPASENAPSHRFMVGRSEENPVGKGLVRTCRSRWEPDNAKNN